MYSKRLNAIGIAFCLVVSSCTSKIDEEVKILKQTSIQLPLDKMELVTSPLRTDTTMNDADLYYVAYEDSSSCNSCRLSQIGNWNSVIKNANTKIKVAFIFILTPKAEDVGKAKQIYYKQRFPYNIYIDHEGYFEKMNPIVKNVLFHHLLINRDGKVIYIGDPTLGQVAMEMFTKTIDYWSEHYKDVIKK